MIDLDRHIAANQPANLALAYNSVMYKGKQGWLCNNLDWKQLGLMINWLITDDSVISDDVYDYHQVGCVDDPFLKSLLFEGQFTICIVVIFMKLKGHCTFVGSVVLLLIGVRRKVAFMIE